MGFFFNWERLYFRFRSLFIYPGPQLHDFTAVDNTSSRPDRIPVFYGSIINFVRIAYRLYSDNILPVIHHKITFFNSATAALISLILPTRRISTAARSLCSSLGIQHFKTIAPPPPTPPPPLLQTSSTLSKISRPTVSPAKNYCPCRALHQ